MSGLGSTPALKRKRLTSQYKRIQSCGKTLSDMRNGCRSRGGEEIPNVAAPPIRRGYSDATPPKFWVGIFVGCARGLEILIVHVKVCYLGRFDMTTRVRLLAMLVIKSSLMTR